MFSAETLDGFGKILVRETEEEQEGKRKKQRRNNAAVNTAFGANGIVALHQTRQRDQRLNKEASEKNRSSLEREVRSLRTTVSGIASLKKRKTANFWVVDESWSQADMQLILRLFAPNSKMLNKNKVMQWEFLRDNVCRTLTELKVLAKEEECIKRLAEIQEELGENNDDDSDDIPTQQQEAPTPPQRQHDHNEPSDQQ